MKDVLAIASGWVSLITLPVCIYFLKQILDEFRQIKKEVAEHQTRISIIETLLQLTK